MFSSHFNSLQKLTLLIEFSSWKDLSLSSIIPFLLFPSQLALLGVLMKFSQHMPPGAHLIFLPAVLPMPKDFNYHQHMVKCYL